MRSLLCPVSAVRINRNAARVTAFLMAGLMAIYIASGATLVIVAIVAGLDYFIRAFTPASRSPISSLASSLASLGGLAWRPTDKAPKIFAARVGFVFATAVVTLHWIAPAASLAIALILMGFALLESILDICVGCFVYTYVILPAYASAAR